MTAILVAWPRLLVRQSLVTPHLGVPVEYLLAASLMAIQGDLFARLLSPATESSPVSFNNLSFTETSPKSSIEAAATGAMTWLKIAAGVATVVMAFVAIIALINGIIGGVGGGLVLHMPRWSPIQVTCGPTGVGVGVDWSDANLAWKLDWTETGNKWIVAYSISHRICKRVALACKTVAIISFALCGFANVGLSGWWWGVFCGCATPCAEIAKPVYARWRRRHFLT
ncbi:nucleoside transporter C-terminal domain-containing protein [Shigella flexneri]